MCSISICNFVLEEEDFLFCFHEWFPVEVAYRRMHVDDKMIVRTLEVLTTRFLHVDTLMI